MLWDVFNPSVSASWRPVLCVESHLITVIDCSKLLLLVSSHLVTTSAVIMILPVPSVQSVGQIWLSAMWHLFPVDVPIQRSDDLLLQYGDDPAHQLITACPTGYLVVCVYMYGCTGGWAGAFTFKNYVSSCVFSFICEEINLFNCFFIV